MTPPSGARGFTLVEALVASFLIALACMAMMALACALAPWSTRLLGSGPLSQSESLIVRQLLPAVANASCALPQADPPGLLLYSGRDCDGTSLGGAQEEYAVVCVSSPKRQLRYRRGPWREAYADDGRPTPAGRLALACDPALPHWANLSLPPARVLSARFSAAPGARNVVQVALELGVDAPGGGMPQTLRIDAAPAFQGRL